MLLDAAFSLVAVVWALLHFVRYLATRNTSLPPPTPPRAAAHIDDAQGRHARPPRRPFPARSICRRSRALGMLLASGVPPKVSTQLNLYLRISCLFRPADGGDGGAGPAAPAPVDTVAAALADIAYRMAFNDILCKLARSRAEIPTMDRVRAHFNAEYGQHSPEDLHRCFSIANAPTAWEIALMNSTTFGRVVRAAGLLKRRI
ncbi:hypothetical protein HYPSUDRAFT_203287 [Hypholoma sublateritium FD-334 SS-4]|uniref:Uncharacterized protein n=1 Tax=Hypholoma sublateritium (strain FD-334 SS-4) TaxID=945553 RepID=A0A0D2NX94_HYPSF|nr:hypothetical protein HYPSUDRAFT_203287 [Hypholoma sublateritium FD-334 SS-4]